MSKTELSYNTSHQCSTKLSPFKVLYDRDPPHLLQGAGQTPVNIIEERLQERDLIFDDLHFNLIRALQIMKSIVDLKQRDDAFEVNDFFYLNL